MSGHFTQFYKSERDLIVPLSRYIQDGIQAGDTCIVIATSRHIDSLNLQLENLGTDVSAAVASGQYIVFDAALALSTFMLNGLPQKELFIQEMGAIIEEAIQRGNPVRAYGEMVALLWRDGKKDAVIKLENLWNDLIEAYPIALYCAYPELHFIMDADALNEICHCHSMTLSGNAVG